jgi:FAD synthase
VEPHLIHDFGDEDFYGDELRFLVLGYVRPERSFPSLGEC